MKPTRTSLGTVYKNAPRRGVGAPSAMRKQTSANGPRKALVSKRPRFTHRCTIEQSKHATNNAIQNYLYSPPVSMTHEKAQTR